jgi:pimeloyl-ACP methyl ester carboxylesterase
MPDPQIRYVRNADGLNIAYYVLGDGRPLISMSPTLATSIAMEWEIPLVRRTAEITSRSFRFVRFDLHGGGVSDHDDADVSLESYVRDLEAVADAAAPGQFALFAPGASSTVAIAYAARHPERLTHLILWMAFADGADFQTPSHESLLELALTDWAHGMRVDDSRLRRLGARRVGSAERGDDARVGEA